MSTTVDSRVVEMRFDNQHFERNVQTSMSTLDRLKEKLNLGGAAKGLENINSESRKMNFSGLSGAVETVTAKFSALEVMGVTALANITNSAVNAGKRMVSALTIDPIKTGFSEYETQINAVQTILANTSSKGTTLQDVNNALDTLNTYADKTIYNFTEMTRNIGTFTAAGVDLDKSVSAIQGIANLAAVSGSSSQQASTAMYQLSQALAAGRVSLMDWNSVVNAGMGGQVFQDALKRTAKNMGIVVDESKSFRESISGRDTWLSSDVLIKTLEQFTMAAEEGTEQWELYKKSLMDDGYTEAQATEILKMANTATDAATKVKTFTQLWDTLKESAQSGWTQTWEIIVGDFGEAKELLTEISDTIGKMIGSTSEARNALLSEGLSSGWKQLLGAGIADEEGYKDAIKSIAKEHGIAFDEIIKKTEEAGGSFEDALIKSLKDGTITSDMLSESVTHLADGMRKMTDEERLAAGYTDEHVKAIEELEKGLKDGSISMDEFVEKMTRLSGRENLIQALWNSFNALMDIIKPVKEAFREVFPPMTGEQLYKFTENVRKLTENFKISDTTANNLKRTFKGVFALLDIGVKAVSALFKGFSKLAGYISPAAGGILEFTAGIGDFLVSVNDALESSDAFNKAIEKIGKFLKPVGDGIKEFAKSISDSFDEIGSKAKVRLEPLTILGDFLMGIFRGLAGLIGKVAPVFASLAKNLGEVFGNFMDGIASAIQGADYNKLFDIFNGGVFAAIGIYIAKFMKSVSDIVGEGGGFLENIQELLGGVGDALNAFTGSLKADTLKKIATAIAILAASLLILSIIDSDKLTGSLAAITVLFAELCGSLTLFSKLVADNKGFGKLPLIAATLVGLSTSLLILAAAVKILSTMSWNEMGVGLVSITVGLGALVGALWLLPDGEFDKASKAIRKLSTSLVVFAVAMKILGSMSWNELAVGLTATVVGLGALVGALHLLPKDMTGKAGAMLIMAASLVILGGALKIMASMSWGEVGRSLASLAGSLIILTVAMNAMLLALPGALALKTVSKGLIALSVALKIMGSMSWEEIVKGLTALAGSLLVMGLTLSKMKENIAGAKSIVILAMSLMILTPVLKSLGSMSWGEIARGLVTLAGAFVIIGIAGAVLGPLAPAIIALSKSIALLGLSIAAIGAGVLMFGLGMTALSTALATGGAAITLFVSSIIGLIPYFIEQIGVGFIKLCEVISGSASAICEAFTVIVTSLVDAIVVSAPAIAEGIFVLIDELLGVLVKYTPKIATALFDFLIEVINAVAEKMPELIKAGVNLLMSFFEGVVNALKEIDTRSLVNGILAVGMITALMYAFASFAALTPAAMIGVLGVGVVIAELSLVLAAIGALAQIPGLEWLINEGGEFLQSIGTAIGKFIGGLVSGFASGIVSSLPQIGTDLSAFMTNLKPFIDGAKSFDASSLEGVKSLAGVILALTAANVVDGLASWVTGGSSLTKFGEEIAAFAPNLKLYADTVKGIDGSAVEASAHAAKVLSELANNLPNSGGLAGFFAGENDISSFGEQLVPFGKSMMAYSEAIVGFNPTAVIASVNAAKALADLTAHVPNQGGVVAWFTGENSISRFGEELVGLGMGLKQYSMAIVGFNAEAVIASANAAKSIAQMTSYIPNQGGIAAWFSGDNSISKFGGDLIALGLGLKGFSTAIIGVNTEAIISASNAAKSLAQMTSYIPNQGGIAAWFTGENSVSKFADDLVILGRGLLGFSTAVIGINAENMIAASNAAKALAQMTTYIPNEGGIAAWFTGENSIANFAHQLPLLGTGLLSFSTSVAGINAENMIAASNAAKSIAQMTTYIPNEGGVVAWFTGESSIASFASKLPILGMGLFGFSTAVAGINPENITAASESAKSLAEMTTHIPTEGGIKAWFSGENSIANFASQLPILGMGLLGFSTSIAGINPENVTAAAGAAKALAEMTAVIPTEGGIKAWFTGETSIANFADKLPTLGAGLKGFSESVAGINPENITAASDAAKNLAQMANTAPEDSTNMVSFGDNLVLFGAKLKGYFENTSGITSESISLSSNAINSVKDTTSGLNAATLTTAATAISELVKSVKGMSKITESTVTGFNSAMKKLAENNIKSVLKSFDGAGPKMSKAGQTLMDKFVEGVKKQGDKVKNAGETVIKKFSDGIKSSESKATKACSKVASACLDELKDYASKFSSAGSAVVDGFADGISANTFKAEAKAAAMAQAALSAAKAALAINSPSKVFRAIGYSVPEGFAMGIERMGYMVKTASVGMTDTALDGVKGAISRISDLVNSDIDSQPVIRPVLDLSDIQSGAGAINGLFGMTPSVGVMSNVRAINSMMSRNQNGGNAEIISAIDKLRGYLSNIGGDTYQINGITYGADSDVSNAIQTLVRAIKVEGRI